MCSIPSESKKELAIRPNLITDVQQFTTKVVCAAHSLSTASLSSKANSTRMDLHELFGFGQAFSHNRMYQRCSRSGVGVIDVHFTTNTPLFLMEYASGSSLGTASS